MRSTSNRSRIMSEESVEGLGVAAEKVQKEADLAKEISSLWSSHNMRKWLIRDNRAELKAYRNRLAESTKPPRSISEHGPARTI